MKKQCIVIKSSSDYNSTYNRHLCIDEDSAKEILACIDLNIKKFRQIQERILTLANIYYDYYGKEGINKKTKDITAIKFRNPENTRIYCQEMKNEEGHFFIICAAVLSKKSQKNNKSNNPVIEKIASYEYEIKFPGK